MGEFEPYLDEECRLIANKIKKRGRGAWSQFIRASLVAWHEKNLDLQEAKERMRKINLTEKENKQRKKELETRVAQLEKKEKREREIKQTYPQEAINIIKPCFTELELRRLWNGRQENYLRLVDGLTFEKLKKIWLEIKPPQLVGPVN